MIRLITLILLFWLGFEYFFFLKKTSRRLHAIRYRHPYWPDLLIFGTQFFIAACFFRQQWRSEPVSEQHLTAVILILSGLLLRWYSIQILGKYFTADLAVFNEHPIIEAGPYKLIRHPQYLGGWITFLGGGFLLPAPARFIVWALPLATFSLKIIWEEKMLAQIWKEKYWQYRWRTRYVIPYLF